MKEKKNGPNVCPPLRNRSHRSSQCFLILTIGKGVFGYSTEPLLIMVAAIAAFIAFRVGVTWDEMMDEICTKIAKGMPAILILVCVGAMVGTWMAAGTIPMMIYYGVQIVNPKFMLVTAFLIEAVVSVVTGTYGVLSQPWGCPDGNCKCSGCISSGYRRCMYRRFLLR